MRNAHESHPYVWSRLQVVCGQEYEDTDADQDGLACGAISTYLCEWTVTEA